VSVDPLCAASQVAVLERADTPGDEPDLTGLFREYLPGHVPAGAVADDILATFTGLLADTACEVPGIFSEEAGLRTLLGIGPAGVEQAGLLIPVQEARWTGAREAGRTQG
jgi:hypothetical protein